MSTTAPDGLDSLDALAQRAKRTPPARRRVLAPQNPASPAPLSASTQIPLAQAEKTAEELEGHLTPPMFDTTREALTAGALAVAEQASSTSEAAPRKAELRKVAVYLDEDLEAALDSIHYAGASQRPRQDVSKSAVVRLALQRLLGDLTHEQVVAAIVERPTDPKATGRKRR